MGNFYPKKPPLKVMTMNLRRELSNSKKFCKVLNGCLQKRTLHWALNSRENNFELKMRLKLFSIGVTSNLCNLVKVYSEHKISYHLLLWLQVYHGIKENYEFSLSLRTSISNSSTQFEKLD